jgi:hypothetical protein
VLCAYPALSIWAKATFPSSVDALAQWEKQSGASLLAVLFLRYMRKETLDAWLNDVFTYAKSSIMLLTYFMAGRRWKAGQMDANRHSLSRYSHVVVYAMSLNPQLNPLSCHAYEYTTEATVLNDLGTYPFVQVELHKVNEACVSPCLTDPRVLAWYAILNLLMYLYVVGGASYLARLTGPSPTYRANDDTMHFVRVQTRSQRYTLYDYTSGNL